MKKLMGSLCLIVTVCIILVGCQSRQNKSNNEFAKSSTDSTGVSYYSGERKLIHTASIDVEVSNCINTINEIEEKTIHIKGFIVESNIAKNITNKVESVVSTDSIKQINYYQNKGTIIVRVPDTSLQAFLLYVQQQSSSVEARIINAKDVTLALQQKDYGNNQTTSPITNNNSVIQSNNEAAQKLKDDLNYCTISINIKEPVAVETKLIVNEAAKWSKQSSVWANCWLSIQKGFYYLMNFIALLLQLWFIIPLLALGIYSYKKLNGYLLKTNKTNSK
jgi:hypothetical protein